MVVHTIDFDLLQELLKERSIQNVCEEYPLEIIENAFIALVEGDFSQIKRVIETLNTIEEYPVIDTEEGLTNEQLQNIVFERLHRAKERYMKYAEGLSANNIQFFNRASFHE